MKVTRNPSATVLKKLRHSNELTQEELAFKAGLSQSEISKLENGSVPFTEGVIMKLAKALNTSTDELKANLLYANEKQNGYHTIKMPLHKNDEATLLMNYALQISEADDETRNILFDKCVNEINSLAARKKNYTNFLETT